MPDSDQASPDVGTGQPFARVVDFDSRSKNERVGARDDISQGTG